MKKFIVCILALSILLAISGCNQKEKTPYLPEAKNDKIYTTVGGGETH